MTVSVCAIVEGDGEVRALPVLLRRLNAWLTPDCDIRVLEPIVVHRMQFLRRDDVFSRYMELAAMKCGERGWILVVLDADDDCPRELGASVAARTKAAVGHRSTAIVLANREYEAWFIAAAQSLHGQRGFCWTPDDASTPPETPRDAKGWIARRMPGTGYHEVTDQPAFSAKFDLAQARSRSRSFQKLCNEWERQMQRFCPPGVDGNLQ